MAPDRSAFGRARQDKDRTPLTRALSRLGAISRLEELEPVFRRLRARFGLTHIAFQALLPEADHLATPRIWSTYPSGWRQLHLSGRYLEIDPVVAIIRWGLLPVDWSELKRETADASRFLDAARRHGVGPNGMTIPVRGANGERGLFSVTSDLGWLEWTALRDANMHDLHILSYYVHEKVFALLGRRGSTQAPRLSRRERQCLELLAAGKLHKQVAAALEISESAVRLYLRSARRKLKVTTSHHAVAKASFLDLIAL